MFWCKSMILYSRIQTLRNSVYRVSKKKIMTIICLKTTVSLAVAARETQRRHERITRLNDTYANRARACTNKILRAGANVTPSRWARDVFDVVAVVPTSAAAALPFSRRAVSRELGNPRRQWREPDGRPRPSHEIMPQNGEKRAYTLLLYRYARECFVLIIISKQQRRRVRFDSPLCRGRFFFRVQFTRTSYFIRRVKISHTPRRRPGIHAGTRTVNRVQ